MKKARARWINVYAKPDGTRRRSLEQSTRMQAQRQAHLALVASNCRLLYRIRVRRYLMVSSQDRG